MSREAYDDTAWCAACRRDVTTSSVNTFVPHVPRPGIDRDWCPGTNRTPHGIATEIAASPSG